MTTSNVELLPLPEPFAWVNPHEAEDFIDGEAHHFTALRRGVPDCDFPIYSSEQVRANVEANLATKQAEHERETEALRAELAEARDGWHMANGTADLAMKHRDMAEAHAERLAEALFRKALGWRERTRLDKSDAQLMREKTYEQCADELDELLAALHPTTAQEDK